MTDKLNSEKKADQIRKEIDKELNILQSDYCSTVSLVKTFEKEFLSAWKKYLRTQQHEEFLEISSKFAKLVQMQNEMFLRNEKILEPLFEKLDAVIEENCDPILEIISDDILKQDGALPKGFGGKSEYKSDSFSSGTLPKGF